MYYFLPFIASDGTPTQLEAIKTVNGSECIDVIQMMTTMYFRIRTGIYYNEGNILGSGIVDMTPLQVAAFLISWGFDGNGT